MVASELMSGFHAYVFLKNVYLQIILQTTLIYCFTPDFNIMYNYLNYYYFFV